MGNNLFSLKESFQLAVAGGVAMCPKIPFCKPFLDKQPTTGGESDIAIW